MVIGHWSFALTRVIGYLRLRASLVICAYARHWSFALTRVIGHLRLRASLVIGASHVNDAKQMTPQANDAAGQ